MGSRRSNPKLAKIHRNYTVDDISDTFGVHKNTVRQWIKQGLRTVDDKRPTLILGRWLRSFLESKRSKHKVPCKPGEIYCVKCRTPKQPAGKMADYEVINSTLGNLVGICPTCSILIYRKVNWAKLELVKGDLEILFTEKHKHISKSN